MKKILDPTEFSNSALAVFEDAIATAKKARAELILLFSLIEVARSFPVSAIKSMP